MTQSDNNVKIEYLPLSELIPYEKNPRKNDRAVDIVANSIKEFGFRNPILIDKNNIIIAGHTRLKAALKLGLSQVPVIWIDDLTPAQIKAYRIMDNKSTEYADWNFELLTEEFKGLKDENFDLSLTGFSESELNKIFPQSLDEESMPDIDKPKYEVKRGDIWQLGRHRLMCGDSTSKEDLDNLMNGYKVNMVLTDPPYGVSIVSKTFSTDGGGGPTKFKGTIGASKIVKATIYSQIIGDESNETAKKSYEILSKLTDKLIIWGGNYFTDFLPVSRCWLCWNKKYDEMKSNSFADIELAWTSFDKNAKIYNCLWRGLLKEGEHGKRIHPTQKPLKLCVDILKDFTKDNEIILDVFGGSGSTLIACEQTNRIAYLMELDPLYCSVILERYQNLTKKEPTKLTK